MRERPDTDLLVIGFGSAGMTAAELAAGLGLRVTVVERDRAGGDCLWTGCVPSKALIAAAHIAEQLRRAPLFGLPAMEPRAIDLAAVWARVRAARDELAVGDDDPARFEAMGVSFRWGEGRLTGPHTVSVAGRDGSTSTITAGVVLVCTGSRPVVPDIEGLAETGYETNETLFELSRVPRRLVFVGGGPIAVELAQACRRLGIDATILQRAGTLLPRDEPELVTQLVGALRGEGVVVATDVDVVRVGSGPVVVGTIHGTEHRWPADAIVIAAGRRVDVTALGLDAVGVEVDERGIVVDARGRTTVPSIYAAGDVTGREQFTHAAAHEAALAVRDAFFPGRGRAGAVMPWATFTDPTLAHAGLTVDEAQRRFGARRVRIHRWSLEHNDRAHTDRTTGSIVLVERVGRLRRRLIGAHVLAADAGELIGELVLAIERGLSVAELGGIVHVYPTTATSLQQLGGRAAVEQARRYRWLLRARRRWQ